jgi:hypothetical protein
MSDVILLPKLGDNKIFKFYNPYLLTFPMKAAFQCDNPNKLKQYIKIFISDKFYHNTLTIGDIAYVEYFPQSHKSVFKNVMLEHPEFFEITQWKQSCI